MLSLSLEPRVGSGFFFLFKCNIHIVTGHCSRYTGDCVESLSIASMAWQTYILMPWSWHGHVWGWGHPQPVTVLTLFLLPMCVLTAVFHHLCCFLSDCMHAQHPE